MMNNKLILPFTLSMLGLLVPMCLSAKPQDADNQTTQDIEKITVTGFKASNKAQIDAKQKMKVISDSVSADEIGSLPDFNIAEALQRIPGISTDQDNGEERYVIIRGLRSQYNFSTVDGLILPSSDSASRAVLYDIVPSMVVDRVDVLKSFRADMDGQAIGGRIDMRTRSAFDRPKHFVALNGSLGAMDYTDYGPDEADTSYRANGTYSTTFGSNEQFGFVFAGSLGNFDYYADNPTISGTSPFFFYDANGKRLPKPETVAQANQAAFVVPEFASEYLYHVQRERRGGIAKFEYQSSDDRTHAYAQLFHFGRTDDERRDHFRVRNRDGKTTPANLTTNSGTLVGKSYEPVSELLVQSFEDTMQGVHVGVTRQLSAKGRIDAKLGYSTAELDNQQRITSFFFKSAEAAYSYTLSGDGYTIATPTNPEVWASKSNYKMYRLRFEDIQAEEDVLEARVDYSWNIGNTQQGWGYKVGAKLRDFERERDQTRTEYRPKKGTSIKFDQYGDDHQWTPPSLTVPMPFINSDIFTAAPVSDTNVFSLHGSSKSASFQKDYTISEDVNAFYAMGIWQQDNLDISLGVRYETTDVKGSAFEKVKKEYRPFTTRSSYNNLLPRADLRYQINDDLRLNVAYSRSLGRPDYVQLAPYRSVDVIDDVYVIKGGNPALKPRVSDNVDLSLEYYIPKSTGLLSVGVFHKSIADEIFTMVNFSEQAIQYEGQTLDVRSQQPQNAESAKLTGLELNAIINNFDFLPTGFWQNLGVSFNYSYIDSQAVFGYIDKVDGKNVNLTRAVPLFFQPQNIVNANLFYKDGGFEARLSFNYKDEHLKGIKDADRPWTDRYYDDRSRVDAQVRYWVNDNLRVALKGKNITKSYAQELYATGYHHTKRDLGSQYWLTVSYRH